MKWHLVRPDNAIVRTAQADDVRTARVVLAPIEPGHIVVSALSFALGETREVVRARERAGGGNCQWCNKWISASTYYASEHVGWHRYCYDQKQRREASEAQRQLAIQRKARYLDKLKSQRAASSNDVSTRKDITAHGDARVV